MTHILDLALWEQQWKTLDDTLAAMAGRFAALEQSENPPQRATTMHWLTEALRAFAKSQFCFFYQGFSTDPQQRTTGYQLIPSEAYPVEYIFQTTLDQIAHDIAVLERAAFQRSEVLTIGRRQVQLGDVLHRADQLAQIALEPAIRGGLLRENTTAVTYFQKSTNIRVIPYAPVALVGLPFTALENKRDFLAIPHEIGHYVFRHGLDVATNLRVAVPQQPAWRRRWLEEIFCDAYGALIAGPVAGLSFQDMALSKPLQAFVTDDGEHPVSFIRPNTYLTMFEKMGHTVIRANEALAERWEHVGKLRGQPSSFKTLENGDVVKKEEALALVSETLDVIFEMLQQLPRNGTADYTIPWSQDPKDRTQPVAQRLYDDFEAFIDEQRIAVPELTQVVSPYGKGDSDIWIGVNGRSELPPRMLGKTNSWVDHIKDTKAQPLRIPVSAWLDVLSTDGWNTGGPEGFWRRG